MSLQCSVRLLEHAASSSGSRSVVFTERKDSLALDPTNDLLEKLVHSELSVRLHRGGWGFAVVVLKAQPHTCFLLKVGAGVSCKQAANPLGEGFEKVFATSRVKSL